MCGSPNAGPAPSSGDLLAVIHPVHPAQPHRASQQPVRSRIPTTCLLRLSNSHEAMTTSELSCDASPVAHDYKHERMEVRIHKYGNLLYSPLGAADLATTRVNPVIHTFVIGSDCFAPRGTVVRTSVGRKLRFRADEEGVVGRTVSVLDQQNIVIGEGIIGWG